MNLDQITTECFILSLFIRDDGERFLLGSGAYMFKESQQHFAANTYSNDVVEVQGNDGVFLAGQVRRASTQSFDGYIGDATVRKADIEDYRREFLAFFRKNYYYTVVYIFPNGEAIQRRKGFIVDAPEVQELFQMYPEYHIALNFEDINYYSYSEDSEGHETYTKSATVYLSTGATSGGLVWDNVGAVNFGGINLLPTATGKTENKVTFTVGDDGKVTVSTPDGASTGVTTLEWSGVQLGAGTYTLSGCPTGGSDSTYRMDGVYTSGGSGFVGFDYGSGLTFTLSGNATITFRIRIASGVNLATPVVFSPMVEKSSSPSGYEPYAPSEAHGFVWEAGSGAGPTTVMVDSIDRVYPIWEITGPATNPQLAVLTTGTTISYSGTVSSAQTLVIDMFNKTAQLNGASVIGNVSGDWVYFSPGNNRVTYTTNNADANPSTIYWQEVVG